MTLRLGRNVTQMFGGKGNELYICWIYEQSYFFVFNACKRSDIYDSTENKEWHESWAIFHGVIITLKFIMKVN